MKKKWLCVLGLVFVLAGCGNGGEDGIATTGTDELAVVESTGDENAEVADAETAIDETVATEEVESVGDEGEETVEEPEVLETLEPEKKEMNYELVWSDEFEGDAIDTTKWDFQFGDGRLYGVQGWGNAEEQYYTSREENARVEDGKLLITAIKEDPLFRGMQYTSARMRTVTNTGEVLYATTYGRIEASIKLPVGDGIWPAFWMLPASEEAYGDWAASGEIDIMEVRGRLPRIVNGTLHYGGAWPSNTYTNGFYELPEDMDVTQFHTYSIEWEPEEIRWYVDDYCYFIMTSEDWYCNSIGEVRECADSAPFDVPFYILLNVAVGGNFDPEADMTDTVFPATMEVDYVRVYEAQQEAQ